MRSLHSLMGAGMIIAAALTLSACAVETGSEESAGAPLSTESHALGSNPLQDGTMIKTMVPHGGAAGTTFTDLAINGGKYFLLRSDGYIERWANLASPVYESVYAANVYGAIKNVPLASGPAWGVIGTIPATRKLVKNIQLGAGTNFADWPADASWISQIGLRPRGWTTTARTIASTGSTTRSRAVSPRKSSPSSRKARCAPRCRNGGLARRAQNATGALPRGKRAGRRGSLSLDPLSC